MGMSSKEIKELLQASLNMLVDIRFRGIKIVKAL